MTYDDSRTYRIDVEGTILGETPTGNALQKTQIASVLVAAIRHLGVHDRVELVCDYPSPKAKMVVVCEEGAAAMEVTLSAGDGAPPGGHEEEP